MATTQDRQTSYSPALPREVEPHVRDKDAPVQPAKPPATDRSSFLQQRLLSLDVYRGLIMISLAFVGFGLAQTARNHLAAQPDSAAWQNVYYHFEHVEWTGCGYWDLIQPSFMFMVGVAMAYSYAKRQQLGFSWGQSLRHAIWRSLVLIFLGTFLISNGQRHTEWSLMNVLTQIGLGYTFLFLLWGHSLRTQIIVAACLLVGTWLLYVLYPYSGLDWVNAAGEARDVGISRVWAAEHLDGIAPAWHKNANVGHAIDVWLLNLLPREQPFVFNRGGYQTINFIPSLATMLFGLMCGELLRSRFSSGKRLLILTGAGLASIGVGLLLDVTGICPLVKRIWTPSWALYSTGWCVLILATLYAVVDVLHWRWWTFPLVVVGVNSIAIYCMSMMLKPWTARTLETHFGKDVFKDFGLGYIPPEFAPTVQAVLVGMVFWLACLWMYRNKVFVRI
jgi:predicted acyltransferase